MDIIISKDQDTPTVCIMKLRGALDGNSYENFITEAQELYDSGARNLLLDMSELTF
jgi:anti-anti-sigma regulatory factor